VYGGRVADPVEHLPLLRAGSEDRKRRVRLTGVGEEVALRDRRPLEEFVLGAGDCLYLPRGYFHEAQAEHTDASWHVTFGVHAYTYIDLLTVMLGWAAREMPALRRRLPAGFATFADEAAGVAPHVRAIFSRLAEVADVEAALAGVAQSFHAGRQSLPALATAAGREPVRGDTWLHIRPGGLAYVEKTGKGDDDRVRIAFGGVDVTLPADFEPALRKIATGEPFLPVDLPGSISSDERISLAEKLVQDGLLAVLPDGGKAFG
jgi:hypothetical protein